MQNMPVIMCFFVFIVTNLLGASSIRLDAEEIQGALASSAEDAVQKKETTETSPSSEEEEEAAGTRVLRVTVQEAEYGGMGFEVAKTGALLVTSVDKRHTLPCYWYDDKLKVGDLIKKVNDEDVTDVAEFLVAAMQGKQFTITTFRPNERSDATPSQPRALLAHLDVTVQDKAEFGGMGFTLAHTGPLLVTAVDRRHTLPCYWFNDKLKVGDLITKVNGREVTTQNEFLAAVMGATKFTLTISRLPGQPRPEASAHAFTLCEKVKIVNQGPHGVPVGWVGMIMKIDTEYDGSYNGVKIVPPVYKVEFGRDGEHGWPLEYTYLQDWIQKTDEPFSLHEVKVEATRSVCGKGEYPF